MVYFVPAVTGRSCVAVEGRWDTRVCVAVARCSAEAALPLGGRACSCRGSPGTTCAVHRVVSAVVAEGVCSGGWRGSVCACVCSGGGGVCVSVRRPSTMAG